MNLGRCWYCSGNELPLTAEHVLSLSNFGGRLVAPDCVCAPCNRMVGKLERDIASRPFLAERIGRDGHLFAPRCLARPSTDGILSDGSEGRVTFGPTGAVLTSRRPRKVRELEDGTEVWEVAAGQEEVVRGRREASGTRIEIIGRDPTDAPGLQVAWGIGEPNIDLWPRFGAKVALSIASLMLDAEWLDTPGAQALQAVLSHGVVTFDPFPSGPSWQPTELDPRREPARLLGRGEHALGLDRDPEGHPRAWMILFGSLWYAIPVPDADPPEWEPTWHLRPRRPVRGPIAADELLAELR